MKTVNKRHKNSCNELLNKMASTLEGMPENKICRITISGRSDDVKGIEDKNVERADFILVNQNKPRA
jgi:hypothetical protein